MQAFFCWPLCAVVVGRRAAAAFLFFLPSPARCCSRRRLRAFVVVADAHLRSLRHAQWFQRSRSVDVLLSNKRKPSSAPCCGQQLVSVRERTTTRRAVCAPQGKGGKEEEASVAHYHSVEWTEPSQLTEGL